MFNRNRLRLILKRWKDAWGIPVINISLLLNPVTVSHFDFIISKKEMGTSIAFEIDGLKVAEANLRNGLWRLTSSASWLRSTEDTLFVEIPQKGLNSSWYIGEFDSLDKLVEYLVRRADHADCQAFWPVILTPKGWRLCREFKHKEWEPFTTREHCLEFLRTVDAKTTQAFAGSRLSPGKDLLDLK